MIFIKKRTKFNYFKSRIIYRGVLTDCTGNWSSNAWNAGGLVIAHSNVVAVFVIPAPLGKVKKAGTAHRSFAKVSSGWVKVS